MFADQVAEHLAFGFLAEDCERFGKLAVDAFAKWDMLFLSGELD